MEKFNARGYEEGVSVKKKKKVVPKLSRERPLIEKVTHEKLGHSSPRTEMSAFWGQPSSSHLKSHVEDFIP